MKKISAAAIVRLVFGILGGVYAVLGIAFLAYATKAAGSLTRIFTLPENDLTFAILGTVFTALGVVFLGVSIAFALADKRRAALREELLAWGQRVTGVVTEVKNDYTVRVNRRYAKVALVRCPFPRGEVTVKSHRLWGNEPAVGDTVDVLYDPMDESRYVIDFQDK